MRASAALLLSAALSALVGCGSSVGPPPYTPPTAEELKVVASGFHNKEANREVADGQLPLKFLDMEGKTVDLADYKGTSNVLLVVVKGLPQKTTGQFKGQFCPGCLAQVNALVANYDKFKAKNTEVVMVFPGPTESVGKFLADGHVSGGLSGVPFRLVRDTELQAVRALGIDGDLARPSTYILDQNGHAVFAFVGNDTVDRPSVSSLLARLDALKEKRNPMNPNGKK